MSEWICVDNIAIEIGGGYIDIDSESFMNAPSIDICFCRECKHRKKNGFCLEHNRYEKNDNGYCSYGERG